jgi:hypothetical protein
MNSVEKIMIYRLKAFFYGAKCRQELIMFENLTIILLEYPGRESFNTRKNWFNHSLYV